MNSLLLSLVLAIFFAIKIDGVYAVCSSYTSCDTCTNNLESADCAWCVATASCGERGVVQSFCPPQSIKDPRSSFDITSTSANLSPQTITVKLRYLDSIDIPVTITTPETTEIEFFYLTDSSASFDNDLTNFLRPSVDEVATTIQNLCSNQPQGTSYTSGTLCSYGKWATFIEKFPLRNNRVVAPYLPLWNNLAREFTASQQINPIDTNTIFQQSPFEIQTDGNVDFPESGLEALYQAIECTEWDPARRHILLMTTDDTFKPPLAYEQWSIDDNQFNMAADLAHRVKRRGCYFDPTDADITGSADEQEAAAVKKAIEGSIGMMPPSFGQLRNALLENNIITIWAVNQGSGSGFGDHGQTWQYMADEMGGSAFVTDLDATSSNIITKLHEVYDAVSKSITINVLPNEQNRQLYISGISQTFFDEVPLGSSRTVTFTFSATADTPPLSTNFNSPIRVAVLGIGFIEFLTESVSCDCTEALSNGQGNNNCGLIECNDGFTGEICACTENNVNNACPNDCSGNGLCNCGECSCYEGFGGIDCACPDSCPLVNGLECAGRGTCDCGNCLCDAGFNETTNCLCPDSGNNIDCNGGLIVSDTNDPCGQVCQCTYPSYGKNCECTYCSTPCISGTCNCNGECECDDPNFSPDSLCLCETNSYNPTCDSVTTCNGNGACDECGQCDCFSYAYGNSCECLACPDCAFGCSCDGTCNCPPNAEICDSNYCNNRGTCNINPFSCDYECECLSEFTGDLCECVAVSACPITNGQECSGSLQGQCNECEGVCECVNGFVGDDCSCLVNETVCVDPNSNNSDVCNGNGQCTSSGSTCNQCVCDDIFDDNGVRIGSYTGEFCDCASLGCPVDGGCGINSAGCNECEGTCNCLEGYEQPLNTLGCICKTESCYADGNVSDVNAKCNGVGTCNEGLCGCTCPEPYSGEFCQFCNSLDTVLRLVLPTDDYPYCIGENNEIILVTEPTNCTTYICSDAFCLNRGCSDCQNLPEGLNCQWCPANGGCITAELQCGGEINQSCEAESIVPVVAGSVAGVVAAILLAALIAKSVFMYLDRKEWVRFAKSRNNTEWNATQSPIFESTTLENLNPIHTSN